MLNFCLSLYYVLRLADSYGLVVYFPFEKRDGNQLGDIKNHLVEKGTVQTVQGRMGKGILLENSGYALGGERKVFILNLFQ